MLIVGPPFFFVNIENAVSKKNSKAAFYMNRPKSEFPER
jgi:hypothetical protein